MESELIRAHVGFARFNEMSLNFGLSTRVAEPFAQPDTSRRAGTLRRWAADGCNAPTRLSPPAGFGKISLASAWIGRYDRHAWLSLDDR
jgi:ATP/maltotriose-dependent transcriptional regulator MalT